MIVLAISTSSPRGTVAVARGETLLSRIAYDGGTSHAERLSSAVDEALRVAGVERGQLQALACDVGPGSFTGVRVGVATCQGIAVGLGLPVLGVGSLEAMAHAARSDLAGASVLAVLDAKKEEVYAAVFDGAGCAQWGPLHLPSADHAELTEAAGRFGAIVAGEIAAKLGLAGVVRGEAMDLPDAAIMALVVARQLSPDLAGLAGAVLSGDGGGESGSATLGDASALEPRYVRPPDAKPLAEQGRALRPSPPPSTRPAEPGAGEPQGE